MTQELMAIMGDRKAARMPVEQFDAEVAFKLLDRLGDRGLRDREVLRRPRDRALLGDGDEILQLSEGEGHARS
ncbi:hypothetical protein D3C87_2080290 [compost metagenome]